MTYNEDYRVSNPALHMLYTKWAVGHLRIIDRAVKQLADTSNSNMHGCIEALQVARANLVDNNAAYADADQICKIYRHGIDAMSPALNDVVDAP